jgi:hypothetical protein
MRGLDVAGLHSHPFEVGVNRRIDAGFGEITPFDQLGAPSRADPRARGHRPKPSSSRC